MKHALRDGEAADDVDGGDQNGDAAEQRDGRGGRPETCSIPPTRMIPLIAFVTLINGVWSAGVTFHTTCQPTKHASTNTVRCERNSTRSDRADDHEQREREQPKDSARVALFGRLPCAPQAEQPARAA